MNAIVLQEQPVEYQVNTATLDGHRYPVDPMSDEFTDFLVSCFHRGRTKAIERAAQPAAAMPHPKPGKASTRKKSSAKVHA